VSHFDYLDEPAPEPLAHTEGCPVGMLVATLGAAGNVYTHVVDFMPAEAPTCPACLAAYELALDHQAFMLHCGQGRYQWGPTGTPAGM
jgi:hypothetical protein